MTLFLVPQPRLPDARLHPQATQQQQQSAQRYRVVPDEEAPSGRSRRRSRSLTAITADRPVTAPSDYGSSPDVHTGPAPSVLPRSSSLSLGSRAKNRRFHILRSGNRRLASIDTSSSPSLCDDASLDRDREMAAQRSDLALVDATLKGRGLIEEHIKAIDELVDADVSTSTDYEERLAVARQALKAKLSSIDLKLAGRRMSTDGINVGDAPRTPSPTGSFDEVEHNRLRTLVLPQRHPLRPMSTLSPSASTNVAPRMSEASTQTVLSEGDDEAAEEYDLFPGDFEPPASRGLYAPVVLTDAPCHVPLPHTITADVDTSPLGLTYESFLSIGSSTPEPGSGSEIDSRTTTPASLPSDRHPSAYLTPPVKQPEKEAEDCPPLPPPKESPTTPPKDHPTPAGSRLHSIDSVTTGGVSALTLPTAIESAGHGHAFSKNKKWRRLTSDVWTPNPSFFKERLTSVPLFRRKTSNEGSRPSVSSRTESSFEDVPIPPPAPSSVPTSTTPSVLADSMLEWFEKEVESEEEEAEDSAVGPEGSEDAIRRLNGDHAASLARGNETMTWIEAVRDQRSFDYSMSATPRTSNVSGISLPGGDTRVSISSSMSSPPRSRQAKDRPSSATTSTACSSRGSRRHGIVPPPSGPPPPLPLPDLPPGALPKSASTSSIPHPSKAVHSQASKDKGKGKARQHESDDEVGESETVDAQVANRQVRSTSNDSDSTVLGFAHNATPSARLNSSTSFDSAQRRRPHLKVLMKLAPPTIAAAAAAAASTAGSLSSHGSSKKGKSTNKSNAPRADDESEAGHSTTARSPPTTTQDAMLSTLSGLGRDEASSTPMSGPSPAALTVP